MRQVYSLSVWMAVFVFALASAAASAAEAPIRVAFVISEDFNVMDFAGPWEVFQDTELPAVPPETKTRLPFELYTVSAKQNAVTSSGGARVTPKYTFETAPQADIVMIGAQSDVSPALMVWLRKQHAGDATLAAVCVGARQLALTGLLDGKQATTHHNYVSKLSKMYPKVAWQHGQRFVRSDTRLYTAGGLTSGIDLALHLVAERFGDAAALATAEEMEYRSDAWKR